MADIVIVRVCNERDETVVDYSEKALEEIEDGKRKENMRCKTRREIMLLCMGVLCARGT